MLVRSVKMTESNTMNTQFWLVWNIDGGSPKHKHASEQSAITEAERLARMNPGQRFAVLEATHERVCDSMQRIDLRQANECDIPF